MPLISHSVIPAQAGTPAASLLNADADGALVGSYDLASESVPS